MFGLQSVTEDLTTRLEKLTGQPAHPYLRRAIFHSQRDLSLLLDSYERKEPIFLYTGRGPSAAGLHLGHYVQFSFVRYLQRAFNCPLVIQLADDEKLHAQKLSEEEAKRFTDTNLRELQAFDFLPSTFIFVNSQYRRTSQVYEAQVIKLRSLVSLKTLQSIFGFADTCSLAQVELPLYQIAPCFPSSLSDFIPANAHCLVVCGLDQDPYFRLARDLAPTLKVKKPAVIASGYLPALTGEEKMSSSAQVPHTIFLSDTPAQVKKKVQKYAFSGGGGDGSLKEHQRLGGNPLVDIPCRYLAYFELDEERYQRLLKGFATGSVSCRETKEALIAKLSQLIK